MRIKFLLVFLILVLSGSLFAKEVGNFGNEGKTFNGLKLENYRVHRVTDRSEEVYFTKDAFGVGITKGGEFTLNSNNKRINLMGMSGIYAYDKDNPTKLYSFTMKRVDKTGFLGVCPELGLQSEFMVASRDLFIGFVGTVTSDSDKNICLTFALPIDGTTDLVKDKHIWINDFLTGEECSENKEYSNPSTLNENISKFPFGAMMTQYLAIGMGTGPLNSDSKFIFNKDMKSFMNRYDLELKKDTPKDIEFSVFKYSYSWGFRGLYDKYTKIYPDNFSFRAYGQGDNPVTLENINVSFKEMLGKSSYRIKGPLSDNDILYLKSFAYNRPVYYEVSKDDFANDYRKAVIYGFVPVVDNPSPADQKIINELQPVYDIIQKGDWLPVTEAESNNENVVCERYIIGTEKYIVVYNKSNVRRVAFLTLYEYNGENEIINLVDNSKYKIKNKTIDIVLNAGGFAMFKY